MGELFTIGHSNHDAERFAALLARHGIEALVDVRSQPSSRFAPQFNRGALQAALPPGVCYAFMGDSLGGRPPEPHYYDDAGHVLYGPLSREPRFLAGIELLERNARRYRIALLCSEGDPLACHRFLLVTRVLRERGWPADRICHILPSGDVRTEAELAFQGRLLEDAWRSPLSVSPGRAPGASSSGSAEAGSPSSSMYA